MGKFIFSLNSVRLKRDINLLPTLSIGSWEGSYSPTSLNVTFGLWRWVGTLTVRRNRMERTLLLYAEDYADAVDAIHNHDTITKCGYTARLNTLKFISKSGVGELWGVRIFKNK